MSALTVACRERIAELRELESKATPGIWKLWGMDVLSDQDGTSNLDTAIPVCCSYSVEHAKPRTWNATLICRSRNLLPGTLDAFTAILDGHGVTEGMGYLEPSGYGDMPEVCTTCGQFDEYGVPWPCSTVRAIAAALGVTA